MSFICFLFCVVVVCVCCILQATVLKVITGADSRQETKIWITPLATVLRHIKEHGGTGIVSHPI